METVHVQAGTVHNVSFNVDSTLGYNTTITVLYQSSLRVSDLEVLMISPSGRIFDTTNTAVESKPSQGRLRLTIPDSSEVCEKLFVAGLFKFLVTYNRTNI